MSAETKKRGSGAEVKIRRKQRPTEERFQTGDRDGEGGPPETG